MKLLGVIGKPILHSKSPLMHNAALRQAGIEGQYLRLAVDSARQALSLTTEVGISGLNITAPFKQEMFSCVDNLSTEAQQVKAVNTVCLESGVCKGYNTDVFGVNKSLEQYFSQEQISHVLIIGAGGAARACLVALQNKGINISIANRTFSNAKNLAQEFKVTYIGLDKQSLVQAIRNAQLIINTVSTDEEIIPAGLISSQHIIFDAFYGKVTDISKTAKQVGARYISGLEWLLWQGSEAFNLFTGKTASIATMQQSLKEQTARKSRVVALVGLMASGKTSVAVELHRKTGLKLVELDELIEQRAGKSITQMCEQDGEQRFRDLEEELLTESLRDDRLILSCGGGIVNRESNRRLLTNITTIWLWGSANTLKNRIPDTNSRPLLKNSSDIEGKLNSLLAERIPFYAEVADLLIPTGEQTIEQVAHRIITELEMLS